MKLKYVVFASAFVLCCFQKSFGQKDCDVLTVQPSVMVLPRTNEGEDLRTIMDDQPEVRVAISKMKQAFDERGYTTLDFETTLKATMRDEAVTKDNQTEFKNRLFRNIPSDIIVEIDPIFNFSPNGNNATIILEANITDNGQSMASVSMVGNLNRATDKIMLLTATMRKETESDNKPTNSIYVNRNAKEPKLIDVFMATMNGKWSEMREKGKSVKMEFSLAENAGITMDDDVPKQGEKLKYVIEDWLEDTALNNYYVVTFVTETKLMVEDYRYPVRDPKNCSNMTARKVERELDRFFDKINVPVKFDNSRGTIYITIQ
ncbi:DUF6175 family protein [Arenibacter sp. GZD96]|uniref:DUF6175 family protein n=1 Tax=Aurantibrevibacter litoralis TaxID=3106030 RepID=UPI002AFEC841|nr:DUF6175 family protein [Arenibacter sp. GZD-96]MEA1785136.1 DUF6175 family protein [Arenibacter sp. GZD-96]